MTPQEPDPPAVDGVTHQWFVGALDVHVASAGQDGDTAGDERAPVVLVAGWPQHWWCWRHVMGPLALDRAVYAVDLRGQGWTTAVPSGYDKMTMAQAASSVLPMSRSFSVGPKSNP